MKKLAVLCMVLMLALPALAQDALELSETFTTSDGLLTFQHPAAWRFKDSGAKYPGEAYSDEDASGVSVTVGVVQDTTLDAVIADFEEDNPALAQEAFTVDKRDAVRYESSLFRGIRDYRYVIDLGKGDFGTLWLVDKNDDFEALEPTLLAMLASINQSASPATGKPSSGSAVDLDSTIVSGAGTFTVRFPGEKLEAYSTESAPHNVTMTNNPDMFSGGSIQMNKGDVLIIIDFGDAETFSAPAGATLREVAETMHAASPMDNGPVELFTSERFDGYSYTSINSAGLVFTAVYVEVGKGEFVGGMMLNITEAEKDEWMPILVAIIDSVESGSKVESAAPRDATFPETFIRDSDGFTMPYPEGWRVEVGIVGSTDFVLVTKGHTFDLSTPPAAGKPSAVVAYGTMAELTGLPLTMLNPETNASRVIQTIIGATTDEIQALEIAGYNAALVTRSDPNFDNMFVAIMLDDAHFIAANMFTAPGEDEDFFGSVIDMLTLARFGDLPAVELSSAGDKPASGSSDGLALTQHFAAEQSGLAFDLPEDWLAIDVSAELALVVNVQAAMSLMIDQLPPESGQLQVFIFTHNAIDDIGGSDITQKLNILNMTAFTDDVSDLEETEVGGTTLYIGEGGTKAYDKLVILVDTGDGYEFMSAQAAPGEMDDYRDTLLAIATTMAVQ